MLTRRSLTRACMEQRDLNVLSFAFPTRETIPPPIMEAASYWMVTPQSMIRIVDLDKTLAAFRQQEGAGPCPDNATLRGLSALEQVERLLGTLSDSPFRVFVWPLDWI
jgi:hypothetical protein